MPAFDAEDYIEEAIESVVCQSKSNVELIVVDDASEDRTVDIVRGISKGNSNIRLLKLSKNSGEHEARRAGVVVAQGEYISFLDADDILHPDMLGIMYSNAKSTGSCIVMCNAFRINLSGEKTSKGGFFKKDRIVFSDIFKKFCRKKIGSGSMCNKLFKKNLVKEHGFNEHLWRQQHNVDYLENIGCFLVAKQVSIIQDELYGYRDNPNGMSKGSNKVDILIEIIRAYAMAMAIYGPQGVKVQSELSALFAMNASYQVKRYDSLSIRDHDRIQKEMKLIGDKYPNQLKSFIGLWLIDAESLL